MTNLEAIKILDNLKPGDYSNPYEKGEAIVMAISALQAQEAKTQLSAEGTTSDLISRQDAIEVIEEMQMPIMRSMFPEEQFVFKGMSEALSAIKDLPSAQPESEERKAESAQNVPKEDLISRKAAIDALGERPMVWTDDDQYALGERNQYDMNRLAIETLPSAQPEPHWIPVSERLPEYGVAVLTYDGHRFCVEKRIPTIRDDEGEPITGDWWVSDDYDEYDGDYYPNLRDGACIAWMPLPEPARLEND